MALKNRSKVIPPGRKSADAGPKPQVQVIDECVHFVARDRSEYVIDLNFPAKILRNVMTEELEDHEQFRLLLEAVNQNQILDKLDEGSSLDFLQLVTAFFEAFADAAGATAGESESSSE